METQTIQQIIRQELPGLMRDDPALRAYILDLSRQNFADKTETESRFDRILNELQREREERQRDREERQRDREERQRKWDETLAWMSVELSKKRYNTLKDVDRENDAFTPGGVEAAFRNALAGTLEDNLGVKVINVNEYDDEGSVFGHPDQIELDIIIHNGTLVICELKSSVDKAAMYIFERKARFYEQHHNRKAGKLIVISPMIDKKAQKVANQLGIVMYDEPEEVKML
jgi:hypothetical protein